MSAQDAAEKWGITKRRVQLLCASNRISNATRLGNMWAIPSDAKKPVDGRFKATKANQDIKNNNLLKTARNIIRRITSESINNLCTIGYSFEEAKSILLTIFTYVLLSYYIKRNYTENAYVSVEANKIKNTISEITNCVIEPSEEVNQIILHVQNFVEEYAFCCDDALSWCYQFANKMSADSLYSNTQFFTEKYMITSIVGMMDITARKKILDPACGGGNFLLYCIDLFFKETSFPTNNKSKCISKMQSILDKVVGYEIDPQLALVASINLKLKCICMLSDLKYSITPNDFIFFSPNIYFPINKTIGGALEYGKNKQKLNKVGSEYNEEIDNIFAGVDALVTNPPFQTIKGMTDKLKQFLKEYYPLSKCDMCNAFIELSKDVLACDGIAGMVTQNSWMYLDSFEELRRTLLLNCSINQIWELGTNAFYDLNGEKSNVALLLFRKSQPQNDNKVRLISLKTLELAIKENMLSSKKDATAYEKILFQHDIFNNDGSRFDMISSQRLHSLLVSSNKYEEYAIPMQGTSTGNAKELIDFYWNHINDKDWILVSKGGGYSRWCGLNHFSVKWGNNGQYIKETKGSAIRNATYFDETQMVFSDTGTSGLNVRELLPDQIFVASGPGIRIKEGSTNSHLAFLNSRVAAYYIRLLSPKLTIAAGYIAKIPTCLAIIQSRELDEYGKKCIEVKRHRLAKRACNIEFRPVTFSNNFTYSEMAFHWFMEDITDEWTQLQLEAQIDSYITKELSLSHEDIDVINNFIGEKKVFAQESDKVIDYKDLESVLKKSVDFNCNIIRTKTSKKALGCDGLLEFLSQKLNVSCESIYKTLVNQDFYLSNLKERYEGLYLHSVVVSALGYPYKPSSMNLDELVQKLCVDNKGQEAFIKNWVIDSFNDIHYESLMKSPIFEFVKNRNKIVYIKEESNG